MTQLIDLADDIRSTLERTFAYAWEQGQVQPFEDGTWKYVDADYTLSYDPAADGLAMISNTSAWQIQYHEGYLIAPPEADLSDRELKEFDKLTDFLDTRDVAQTIDLRSLTTPIDAGTVPAQLFEQYVAMGEWAYKDAIDSDETRYCIEVGGTYYVVSRNDNTYDYTLYKEGGAITDLDLERLEAFLTFNEIPIQSFEPQADWSRSSWEIATEQANYLLPIAEDLWREQEQSGDLAFDDSTQSYSARLFDEFVGTYSPHTDTFSISSGSGTLVSATNWQENYDPTERGWLLTGLDQLGGIQSETVDRFLEAERWYLALAHVDSHSKKSSTRSRIDEARSALEIEKVEQISPVEEPKQLQQPTIAPIADVQPPVRTESRNSSSTYEAEIDRN